jgi:hypothetical protein
MAASTPPPKKAPAKPGRTATPKGVPKPGKPKSAPRAPKAAAVAATQARQATPPPVKGKVKPTTAPKKVGKKPTARKDMTANGPLGVRNGSGSIPYQGTAPQTGGGIGYSGFGG